jgi:hypothetical protein
VARKHPRLTMVRAVVMVESEGVQAELAMCAWAQCSGIDTTRHHAVDERPSQKKTSTIAKGLR